MTLLTPAQVAEQAHVSRLTVLREIRAGRLPAERVGRDWIIRPEDAATWAAGFVKYREQRERHRKDAP